MKSKRAEPGENRNESARGTLPFPSSPAFPLFFIFRVFAFPHERGLCGGERMFDTEFSIVVAKTFRLLYSLHQLEVRNLLRIYVDFNGNNKVNENQQKYSSFALFN